jgi:hypothetical protein
LAAAAALLLFVSLVRLGSRIVAAKYTAGVTGGSSRASSKPNVHPASPANGRPLNRPTGSTGLSAGAAATMAVSPNAARGALSAAKLKGTARGSESLVLNAAQASFDDELFMPPLGSDTEEPQQQGVVDHGHGIARTRPFAGAAAEAPAETCSFGKGSFDGSAAAASSSTSASAGKAGATSTVGMSLAGSQQVGGTRQGNAPLKGSVEDFTSKSDTASGERALSPVEQAMVSKAARQAAAGAVGFQANSGVATFERPTMSFGKAFPSLDASAGTAKSAWEGTAGTVGIAGTASVAKDASVGAAKSTGVDVSRSEATAKAAFASDAEATGEDAAEPGVASKTVLTDVASAVKGISGWASKLSAAGSSMWASMDEGFSAESKSLPSQKGADCAGAEGRDGKQHSAPGLAAAIVSGANSTPATAPTEETQGNASDLAAAALLSGGPRAPESGASATTSSGSSASAGSEQGMVDNADKAAMGATRSPVPHVPTSGGTEIDQSQTNSGFLRNLFGKPTSSKAAGDQSKDTAPTFSPAMSTKANVTSTPGQLGQASSADLAATAPAIPPVKAITSAAAYKTPGETKATTSTAAATRPRGSTTTVSMVDDNNVAGSSSMVGSAASNELISGAGAATANEVSACAGGERPLDARSATTTPLVVPEGLSSVERALSGLAAYLASPWVPLMTHDEKPPPPIEAPKGRHWADPLSQLRNFGSSMGSDGVAQADEARSSRWDPVGELASAPPPTYSQQDNPVWDPVHVAMTVSRKSQSAAARSGADQDFRWDPIGSAARAAPPTRATMGTMAWDPLASLHKVSVPRDRAKFDPLSQISSIEVPRGHESWDPLSHLLRLEVPGGATEWDPLRKLKHIESFSDQQAEDPLAGLSHLQPPQESFEFDPMQV